MHFLIRVDNKVIKLVWTVVLTILLLYPLLHEFGHAVAAWMFGGKVVRITIFPTFYTECFIRPEQLGCYIMTAMAGILLPLICSVTINTRSVRGFLIALCLQVMSVGYSTGELVCVSKCVLGSVTETSDLSVLIYETDINPYVPLVLAGLLLILSLVLLAATEPVSGFVPIIQGFRCQPNSSSTSTEYARKKVTVQTP